MRSRWWILSWLRLYRTTSSLHQLVLGSFYFRFFDVVFKFFVGLVQDFRLLVFLDVYGYLGF
ncbi:hypothetical protein OIU78_012998 [Salix suchowensis]|nr:hypothetical protein OIU78_012998 [Salix suchowensis]